jgi:hypothetical protein
MNFRDAYEFEPETYSGEGGGIPGMLSRYLQQQSQQQGADVGTPSGAPDFGPQTSFSTQGGLLGRLLSLQAEQSAYQPTSEVGSRATPLTPLDTMDENFRQLTRLLKATEPTQISPPAKTSSIDPADIGKSAGIGIVRGTANAIGLIPDLATGFGHFPNNYVPNLFLRMAGRPQIPVDQPDVIKPWTSDEWQRWSKNFVDYQPQSRAGRYAETIGEMTPMMLAGEGLGAALSGIFRGTQAAGAVLRELPATMAKHAVAPGIAVQTLEEAVPDSNAGQTLQKVYPLARRALPPALAAYRYLGKRVVEQ